MKILHVVWGMKTGGVETMLVNIINEQVRTEEVRLFIVNDFVDEFLVEKISPKCSVRRLNRRPGERNPLKILSLNAWIWRYRPDVIHVHSHKVSRLIVGNWRIVRTIHGMHNLPEEYPRMRALFSISNIVRDFTREQGFESTVVLNGINVSGMRPKDPGASNQRIYRIVQVSRLYIEDKGQDILIKALKRLTEQGITNFRTHFIGTGPSGDMLKQMVKDYKLDEFVVFEGVKSQDFIYQHLNEYDVFVQPSRCEGFGLTVAEAMAARLPVLVSDIEGPMEVIGHGLYGMSFESENVADLAEKLRVILRGGYDYSLVEKARRHVSEKYDVANTARRYVEEYRKLPG